MPPPPRKVDRHGVETEARAKILWGESREEVIAFMVVSGIERAEATEFVEEVLNERAQEIRGAGLRKIFIGIALICLPFGFWIYSVAAGLLNVTEFAFTIVAGLYGIWSLITGIIMFISPKKESGDVVEK